MTTPASITLDYESSEDRILAVINAGRVDASGYWLTRRLTLNIIERANPYLDRMSPVVGNTPQELRGDLAAMERQVALARTEGAVSRAGNDALTDAAAKADLAVEITIAKETNGFALQLRSRNGAHTSLVWSRDHLQRIVLMIEEIAARSGWREGQPVGLKPQQETSKPIRH